MISHDLVIPKQLQKKILAMPSVEVFRVSARSGSKKISSNFSSDRFSALRVSWALTAGGPTSWASRSSPPSYRWASCPSARSRPDTCSSRDRGSKTQETVRLGFEPPAVSCQPASQPTGYQSFLEFYNIIMLNDLAKFFGHLYVWQGQPYPSQVLLGLFVSALNS